MASEIYINELGQAAMAFVGDRSQIWHGLGQELNPDSPLEIWKVQAGFDWEIKSAPAKFRVGDKYHNVPGRRVLFRSDNTDALSVVSDDYKIVQPGEVLEFFRDLVGAAGMQLNTAGVLFGGRRFWAMADTKNWGAVNGNDAIKGNLLLSTSCDGTMATTAMFVATRVVCNNTLRVAMGERGATKVSVNHARVFDPKEIKNNLGLINESWENFLSKVTKLSEAEVSQEKAREFIVNLLSKKASDELKEEVKVHGSMEAKIASMMDRFNTGMGNSGKTMWDLVNGITEHYQHNLGRTKITDRKLWGNFYGGDARRKDAAFEAAVAAVA